MGPLAEGGEGKKRGTIFLMEDFPPSVNLVRKLIKLQAQRLLSLCLCVLSLLLLLCFATHPNKSTLMHSIVLAIMTIGK